MGRRESHIYTIRYRNLWVKGRRTYACVTSLKSSGSPPLSGCNLKALQESSMRHQTRRGPRLTSSCTLSSDRIPTHLARLRGDRKTCCIQLSGDKMDRIPLCAPFFNHSGRKGKCVLEDGARGRRRFYTFLRSCSRILWNLPEFSPCCGSLSQNGNM